jgi:hypothetical protein
MKILSNIKRLHLHPLNIFIWCFVLGSVLYLFIAHWSSDNTNNKYNQLLNHYTIPINHRKPDLSIKDYYKHKTKILQEYQLENGKIIGDHQASKSGTLYSGSILKGGYHVGLPTNMRWDKNHFLDYNTTFSDDIIRMSKITASGKKK